MLLLIILILLIVIVIIYSLSHESFTTVTWKSNSPDLVELPVIDYDPRYMYDRPRLYAPVSPVKSV